MGSTIRVLHFPPGMPPTPVELDFGDSWDELSKLIGGYVERVILDNGIQLFCDEDGISKELPPNVWAEGPRYRGAPIVGPAVVVGYRTTSGGMEVDRSLSDAEVERWSKLRRFLMGVAP
jgi:hypothetical protein